MSIKKHIPNTITCCNLISGCIATSFAFGGNPEMALLWIIIGAVFDFFDGLHRGRDRYAPAAFLRISAVYVGHSPRIPYPGQCTGCIGLHRSVGHHSLYHCTVHRQQQRESQCEDWRTEHPCRLHPADGLRLRIPFSLVEEMPARTERIQRIQQDFL